MITYSHKHLKRRIMAINESNYEFLKDIESLGYTLQATSSSGGWNKLHLLEEGQRVNYQQFRSESYNQRIKDVREHIAGTSKDGIKTDSYLYYATQGLLLKAVAHTLATDRPEGVIAHHIKAKFDSATNHILDKELQVYGKSVHEFTSNLTGVKYPSAVHEKNILVKQIEAMGCDLQVKSSQGVALRIYVVDSKKATIGYANTKSSEDGQTRSVDDVMARIEGRDRISDEKIDRTLMNALKEARAIALVDAYQNNTMTKPEMLSIAKTFDEQSKIYLQDRLTMKGIDTAKFQSDLKEVKTVKHKNKM